MERVERLDIPDQPIFRAEKPPQFNETEIPYQKRSRNLGDLWAFLEQMEQRLVTLEGKIK
jgi:hypothetical protein